MSEGKKRISDVIDILHKNNATKHIIWSRAYGISNKALHLNVFGRSSKADLKVTKSLPPTFAPYLCPLSLPPIFAPYIWIDSN